MMFFNNNFNMNFGFGYNPFATGYFLSPNMNFFAGNYNFGYPSPSYSSIFSPLYNQSYNFNSYNLPYYQSYNPLNQYNYLNTYKPQNFQPIITQPNYAQINTLANSQFMFNKPNFSNFNIGFNENTINTLSQNNITNIDSQQTKINEKEIQRNDDNYGPEFLKKVKEISKRLNCDYKDLLGVMNSESGINSKAQNKNGGATGLIQFMPKTAEKLGTTTKELKNMSPIEQLDYVEKCIQSCKRMANIPDNHKLSGGELYSLVFLPARTNREVLTTSDEKYYTANKGLDKNKDGKITKTELDERVKSFYVSDKSFLA